MTLFFLNRNAVSPVFSRVDAQRNFDNNNRLDVFIPMTDMTEGLLQHYLGDCHRGNVGQY